MRIIDLVYVYHLHEEQELTWHSRIHSHEAEQMELHYFLSGEGTFACQEKVFPVERGLLFLTPAGVVHQVQPGSLKHPLTYFALLFEVQPGDEDIRALGENPCIDAFPRKIGVGHRLRFEEMKNRLRSPVSFQRQSAHYELLAFLLHLRGNLAEKDLPHRPLRDSRSDLLVVQAMEQFQANVFGQISLKELAQHLRISREHLIDLFRDRIGITPMRWYQNLKLETAQSLLLDTTLSVKEISHRLGYSSPFHFSRSFKEFRSFSPRDFRMAHSTSGAPEGMGYVAPSDSDDE